ncbi:MAG: hypothetical protein ACI8TX_002307 [Hyphomicrobiaceae bacterium]|jgi:hypothetical protein
MFHLSFVRAVGAAAIAAAFLVTTVHAADPVAKCQWAKVQAMGKYVYCRTNTEARAAIKAGPVDPARLPRCADRFLGRWEKAELKAAGACDNPPGSDATLAEATSAVYANWAAQYVVGGDADICAGTCDQCTADLLTCDGDLSSCQSSEATCQGDLTACQNQPAGGLPATGDTTVFGTGSDGDVQAGAALSYTDNLDGTITDNNTGLMWEKKDDSGGIHDKDNAYTWSGPSYGTTYNMDGTITTTFLATLNGGGGFAGHTDWRIPNRKELVSIVHLGGSFPAIDPAFHKSATCTGCADVALENCSCTASFSTWSSTTISASDGAAFVKFDGGFVGATAKISEYSVRAVRGGL